MESGNLTCIFSFHSLNLRRIAENSPQTYFNNNVTLKKKLIIIGRNLTKIIGFAAILFTANEAFPCQVELFSECFYNEYKIMHLNAVCVRKEEDRHTISLIPQISKCCNYNLFNLEPVYHKVLISCYVNLLT